MSIRPPPETTGNIWKINLFGGLTAVQGEKEHTHFETRKTAALLACLALFPGRPHSREVLAEQLWPDEDPEATRNRLRQALSTLRRVLDRSDSPGRSILLNDHGDVRLNQAVATTDVGEFEAALRSAASSVDVSERATHLQAAVAIYTGDLIPGYYENWIVTERERLAELLQVALCDLTGALTDIGEIPAAVVCAKRAVTEDSLREDSHCSLMRVYIAAGRNADALRQYRILETALRQEFGTTPSPETRLLLAQLGSTAPVARAPKPTFRRMNDSHSLVPLESEGGAVPLDSQFYIVRPTDEQFEAAIGRHDSIVLVKGARQIGKTSLLARGLQQARQAGARVVFTDLQKLTGEQMESAESLFRAFAEVIVDQLDLDKSLDDSWSPRRSWNVNFERFIRRDVLSNMDSPLVWGLDEVDRLFGYPFGDFVFGLFRSWHNERSVNPDGPWGRLTLAIAYATEAHLFIKDLNQSPFNVGTRLVLEDFTRGEIARMNEHYNSPVGDPADLAKFCRLVGGHPYLVRRALHCMASDGLTISEIESNAEIKEAAFGDHLQRMFGSLTQDETLCGAVRAVLSGQGCPSAESFYRLRSAGVVTGASARDARPRCGLYHDYLQSRLS